MLTRFKQTGLLWPTIAAVMTLGGLVALGTWQMQRLTWKRDLIATIEASLAAPPVPVAALPESSRWTGQTEYTKVALRGVFDHASERHVFTSLPRQASGGGGLGYLVFARFKPAGSEQAIYVNRGFVPERAKAADSRSAGQLAQETGIVALLRRPQARAWFDNASSPEKNVWYVRNPWEWVPSAIREPPAPTPVTAWYLDLLSPTPPGGLPLPLAGKPEIANSHLEYALTWYGLALTLIGVYSAFAYARLRDFAQHS